MCAGTDAMTTPISHFWLFHAPTPAGTRRVVATDVPPSVHTAASSPFAKAWWVHHRHDLAVPTPRFSWAPARLQELIGLGVAVMETPCAMGALCSDHAASFKNFYMAKFYAEKVLWYFAVIPLHVVLQTDSKINIPRKTLQEGWLERPERGEQRCLQRTTLRIFQELPQVVVNNLILETSGVRGVRYPPRSIPVRDLMSKLGWTNRPWRALLLGLEFV